MSLSRRVASSSLCLAILLVAPARAGDHVPATGSPIRSASAATRHAGTLHLGTGRWTRRSSLGLTAGLDVVYDNTCPSEYFVTSEPGLTFTEDGRLPSTSGPSTPSSWIPNAWDQLPGCADGYVIDGFQIAYCTDAASFSALIRFQESYVSCDPLGLPAATFPLSGLPGSASGSQACWIVDVDLAASGLSFTMAADGDGSYQGPATNELFGWSFEGLGPFSPASGPKIVPIGMNSNSESSRTDGTRWDVVPGSPSPIWPSNLPEWGFGMDTQDAIRFDGGTGFQGCYFKDDFIGMHLQLYSDTGCGAAPPLPGTPFCTGDGLDPTVTTPCPCGNVGYPQHGCSYGHHGQGGYLTASGSTAIDPQSGTDTVVLQAAAIASTTTLFFRGDLAIASGVPFGDGIRCAGGALVRLAVKQASFTTATFPEAGDPSLSQAGQTPIGSGFVAYYQAYFREPTPGFCPPHAFNATSGWTITW